MFCMPGCLYVHNKIFRKVYHVDKSTKQTLTIWYNSQLGFFVWIFPTESIIYELITFNKRDFKQFKKLSALFELLRLI